MALIDVAKEAIFLHRLLSSFNYDISNWSLLIKTDFDLALKHIKNNINYPCIKHINCHHHYIYEVYNNCEINIEHVPAADQTVDIVTKPLGTTMHTHAIDLLNLQCFAIPSY